jgi:UDP-N-acetylglucosamine 3-dehydrogenase
MTRRGGRLRVLMVGCGEAARMHSKVLRRLSNVDLFYASRDGRRADAYRREFSGAGSFASYEHGIHHDVHLVVVTTPTVLHHELSLQALHAGKHVVIEKPAFMTSGEANDVRSTAEASGLRVFVAENYYYKPVAEYLRRAIGAGELGDVRFVTINATKWQKAVGWRADPVQAGGDALFEGGVHWVSFASNIGLAVRSVRRYPTNGADSALVVFDYAGGAVGTLAHSWELAAPFGGLRMSKVQGTRGAVTFESNGLAFVASGRSTTVRVPALRDPLGRRAMWKDFLSALRSGAPSRFTLQMAQCDLQRLEQACTLVPPAL